MIKNFLNPEGHQNPINSSKVTDILLKGRILSLGGASAMEGLRSMGLSRLVPLVSPYSHFCYTTACFLLAPLLHFCLLPTGILALLVSALYSDSFPTSVCSPPSPSVNKCLQPTLTLPQLVSAPYSQQSLYFILLLPSLCYTGVC